MLVLLLLRRCFYRQILDLVYGASWDLTRLHFDLLLGTTTLNLIHINLFLTSTTRFSLLPLHSFRAVHAAFYG